MWLWLTGVRRFMFVLLNAMITKMSTDGWRVTSVERVTKIYIPWTEHAEEQRGTTSRHRRPSRHHHHHLVPDISSDDISFRLCTVKNFYTSQLEATIYYYSPLWIINSIDYHSYTLKCIMWQANVQSYNSRTATCLILIRCVAWHSPSVRLYINKYSCKLQNKKFMLSL